MKECNVCLDDKHRLIVKNCCTFEICVECIQKYDKKFCPHCNKKLHYKLYSNFFIKSADLDIKKFDVITNLTGVRRLKIINARGDVFYINSDTINQFPLPVICLGYSTISLEVDGHFTYDGFLLSTEQRTALISRVWICGEYLIDFGTIYPFSRKLSDTRYSSSVKTDSSGLKTVESCVKSCS